jgi:hypothetical protein
MMTIGIAARLLLVPAPLLLRRPAGMANADAPDVGLGAVAIALVLPPLPQHQLQPA